jgi:hypothetical protein
MPVFNITTNLTEDAIDQAFWQDNIPWNYSKPKNANEANTRGDTIRGLTQGRGATIFNKEFLNTFKLNATSSNKPIVDLDNNTIISGSCIAHVRGEITRGGSTVSYTLKLPKAVRIFNFNKASKTYALYRPCYDPTGIRDMISVGLSNNLGMMASCAQPIELQVNGISNGFYVVFQTTEDVYKLLGLPNKPNQMFATINKLDWSTKNNFISIKVDNRLSWNSFTLNAHTQNTNYGTNGPSIPGDHQNDDITVELLDPVSNLTEVQLTTTKVDGDIGMTPSLPDATTVANMKTLEILLNKFTNFLFSDSSIDEYENYIDEKSFIIFLLCAELRNDNDTYRHNTYFSIDANNKIVMGPVWDMDLSMCNFTYGSACNMNGWRFLYSLGSDGGTQSNMYGGTTFRQAADWRAGGEPAVGAAAWFGKLMLNAKFLANVKTFWNSNNILKLTQMLIDFYTKNFGTALENDSASRNCMWSGGFYCGANQSKTCGFSDAVKYLNDYLKGRYDWINSELNK